MLLVHTDAFISIKIDPEDLIEVGEFFQTIIINEQPQDIIKIPVYRVVLIFVKKVVFGMVHLCGVAAALIGANVISTKIIPSADVLPVPIQVPVQKQNSSTTTTTPKTPIFVLPNDLKHLMADVCEVEFGCYKNAYWKTCHTTNKERNMRMWCHTAPDQHSRAFQYCTRATNCSKCWDCAEVCHN